MKTTILFFSCWLLASPWVLAQGLNDGLTKQIAKETCEDLSKTDFSKKTPDEFKISLGLSLVKVMGQHQSELTPVGITISDPKSVEKLATDVGVRMVTDCPGFLDFFAKNQASIETLTQKGTSRGGSISGTLVKIVGGEFTYLQVQDAKGKIEKLWWMEYFDGSNRLALNPQSQLNKPIKVNYVEREVFNSTLSDYVKVKVITSVE